MEKFKSSLVNVVTFAIVLAIYGGWYMYKQHRYQSARNIQMEIRRLEEAKPKAGVVVDPDGTIRWQD